VSAGAGWAFPGVARSGASTGPTALRDALRAYLAGAGLDGAERLAEIASCWYEVVGPQVAAHATPRRLRGDELTVSVDHPSWATQLAFLGPGICAALNERLGTEVVQHLNVHVAARPGLD
jgi:predicted nucleic acid-binding Zn ribbon protein